MHGIRAEDGFGLCSLFPPDSPTTTSVAFAFQTGEVWCTDTDFLRYGQTIPFVEPVYIERLSDYARFLRSLGIDPPYRWICGMTGVKGYRAQVPVPPGHTRPGQGPRCLSETIKMNGTFDGVESAQTALLPFFEEIFHRRGLWRAAPRSPATVLGLSSAAAVELLTPLRLMQSNSEASQSACGWLLLVLFAKIKTAMSLPSDDRRWTQFA